MGYRRGYGRGLGFGFGRGYGLGYGKGLGWGYKYYMDPSRCARFPWMPRWWWSNPSYEGTYPVGVVSPAAVPYTPPVEEKEYLEDQMKYIERELATIKNRLDELRAEQTS